MVLSLTTLLGAFGDFVWNLLRLGAFFMVVPVFGNQLVSRRIRVALSVAAALALTPVLKAGVDIAAWDLSTMLDLMVQIAFAIGLGFTATIFFQLFVIAGQFIGMQMGLGFAAMVDPGNGVQVTVWSQFFLMLVTLCFLAIDGHLVLFEILIRGFQLYPVGSDFALAEFGYRIGVLGGWMFVGGILLAIPAVVSLLIVNLAFGVMNRSAPQLNVFALGFPFGLIFGIAIIWILLSGWGDQFHRLVTVFFEQVVAMVEL